MADLLHANAIQQLEVAPLHSPGAQVFDLLTSAWVQTKPILTPTVTQPLPQAYTSTPLAPAPTSVPVLGVSSPITTASMPSNECLTAITVSQDVSESTPKCHHITLTLILSSDSPMPAISSTSSGPSAKSVLYPVIVVPKLIVPMEAYPEHLNWPGGSKEYLCHLCTF